MADRHEVVISGMAGRFPESSTLGEFQKNLLNKVDMITDDDRRWKPVSLLGEIPHHCGKIDERDDMDMTYFGLHRRLCVVTDPHQRVCLELTVSAMIDAGCNPNDYWGSNTAVITSSVTSETEYECLMDLLNIGLSILGHSRSMQANRISYSLNLQGPSIMMDSSWNGGTEGLAYAADLISKGTVRSAIVAACSLMYTAEVTYHYNRMGRLNHNERTKCFSDDATGYNRSEGCVVFFLQRKEDALRSYGSPLLIRSCYVGSKLDPISEITKETFTKFLEKLYEDENIDPNVIAYVEAAGVASRVVDAAELNALGEVFLKKRKEPLLVGCVKSNIGHTEAAASSVALAKALITANSGTIPPNLHYNEPNKLVPFLKTGEIQVVTEPTPLKGDILAVNNFGCAAGFSHVLLKRHDKTKVRNPEKNVLPPDGLPRLFIMSARKEEGLKEVLKKVDQMPIDEEYIALTNRAFRKGIKKHLYRGYTVLNDQNKVVHGSKAFFTGGQPVPPIWFVFTGMGSQWPGMGVELMKLPTFAKAVNNCHEVLKSRGIDLINIVTTPDPEIFNNILHSFVGIAAIQIGLVDVLTKIGIKPDGIIGHSVGELGCAYADGCLTAEQMILAAYARGRASIESDLIQGMMAAVGRGYKTIKNDLPEGIEVACHNSPDSCTLSGPTKLMEEYIENLRKRGIFAKLVNVANIAYHSRYIRPAAPALLRYLKEVIPNPKLRSSKWVSSSVPESDWDKETARYCSAEYHTNNLLGSVLFEEASTHIPQDALIIEIAPHGLLQAILKRTFPNAINVPLTSRNETSGLIFLMNALGKLYLEGIDMDLEKLYPPIEFPVSRGTPSLDDLVVWDHSEKWRINITSGIEDYDSEVCRISVKAGSLLLNTKSDKYKYLEDYKVYGSTVIPLSLPLDLIIQDYQKLRQNNRIVMIQNIHLKKYQVIDKEQFHLYLSLGKGTGYWEVCMDNDGLAIGHIETVLSDLKTMGSTAIGSEILPEEVYSYFSHMGHELGPSFRLFKSLRLSSSEISAVLQWNGSFATFLDAIFKLPALLSIRENKLHLVSKIKQLIIDFSKFKEDEKKEVLVHYNYNTGKLVCDGLQMLYPRCSLPVVKPNPDRTVLYQELKFIPYDSSEVKVNKELLEFSINILFDSLHVKPGPQMKLTVIEVRENAVVHNDLHNILKWRNEIDITMRVAASDSSLIGYSIDSEMEYCFIVTGSNEIENSLEVLSKSKGGFLLYIGDCLPLLDRRLSIIFSKILGDKTYTLCRLTRPINENLKYISMGSADWQTQLENKLQEGGNEIIYLAGAITSLSTIDCIMGQYNKHPNASLLRYIFIDSDIYEFQPINFKEQLQKDLKVNILREGKWGMCKLVPMDFQIEEKTSLKSVYTFSDIWIEGGIDLKALGLNFSDVLNNNRKLEVFEYSGVHKLNNVCGIGRLSQKTNIIRPDPIYLWNKPEGWTHEDAASVLLPYSMAYYILNTKLNYSSKLVDRILIHRGSLPLSRAIINVALSNGSCIYTTYKDEEEKEQIMQLFPQIPESNILSSTGQFDTIILDKTKGEGMRIIVNTLAEKELVNPSVKCLGVEGIFFQVSQQAFKEDEKLGMFVFLRLPAVTGLTPDVMLNLDDDTKQLIQRAVQEGLADGTIKPLTTIKMTSGNTNISAKAVLSENSDVKAVVSMEDRIPRIQGPYICNKGATYAVIGSEEGFWLDIVEWLLKRGAKTVYTFTSENMLTGIVMEKLRKLQLRNPQFNCIIFPKSVLQNHHSAEAFIGGINKTGNLDTIFITSEGNNETTKVILEVSKKVKVVVLSEKANITCEERFKTGSPTLAISLPHHLLTPFEILPRLDYLLNSTQQNVFISERIIKHIEVDMERTAYFQHLPRSVEDLLALAKGPEKCQWKEIKTCCPVLKNCPELSPVFVIPPLRTGQMDPIVKSMFHPTFVAVMAERIQNFEEIAYQLYQDIGRFNTGVFTIICSDWSWPVGIILGKLLERDSKVVSLIFFESSITWESITSYQQVFNVVKKDMSYNSLSDKEKDIHTSKVQKALEKLKYLLNLFGTQLPTTSPKIRGICHYIRNNQSLKSERIDKLQEYCEQTINIYTVEETDYLKMMKNKDLINHINTCILFEYKDAARKMEKTYVKSSIYDNSRLSYLTFLQSLQLNKCR